jgi:NAD(P)-dependent dehydrogenase (short-subunit alcohol dehydrogenase family)
MASNKVVIVTRGSQGIGAAVVQAGYNVVATSPSVSKAGFAPSPNLTLVDGDIGRSATGEKVAHTAISKLGSIDHLVNNAASSRRSASQTTRPTTFATWSPPTLRALFLLRNSPSSRCCHKAQVAA